MEVVIIANKSKHAKRNGFHRSNWLGERSRFSHCKPLPVTVQHETIAFIILYNPWSIRLLKWDEKWYWCISFPSAESEILSTVGNNSLLWILQKTTGLCLIMVKTTIPTLHAQTEWVIRDKWQIARRNEMLCTLKATSVFAFCLARESQHFDVLPHPYSKMHSLCQVNSFPIFQAAKVTSGNWFDVLTFHLEKSIKTYLRETFQMKMLKVLRGWFWNMYHLNEICQSHTKAQEN